MGLSNGTAAAPADTVKKPWYSLFVGHPKGFWFIFWGEFAERCSFYGMMSILARYVSEIIFSDMPRQDADSIANIYVSLFKAACYFLPLLGGFLADRYFGKYWMIVTFSVPYILGHVILTNEILPAMIVALVLLAMGSGVTKPNISTLMGLTYDQQRPGDEHLRTSAFTIFYMAINVGAGLAFFFIPMIRGSGSDPSQHNYALAFLVPAFLMAIALVLFAAGKPFYAKEVITRKVTTPEERALQWKVLGTVSGLFLVVVFFWAIFDQSHTTWIFFARDYMETRLFGFELSPEQFGTLNPVLIVLLAPLGPVLFLWLEKRGFKVRATNKLMAGFVLTAATMAVMAIAGSQAGQAEQRQVVKNNVPQVKNGEPVMYNYVNPEEKVSIAWLVVAFVLITVAEILISVTGLELAFVVSPPSMKSFITGIWLAAVGIGNSVINVPVGSLYPFMRPGVYFGLLAGMMLAIIVVFYFVGNWFNRKMAEKHALPPETEQTTAIKAAATTAEA